jgi:hypothetical protein
MDMYENMFSASGMLNEQIARQVFELLPDAGPLMLIMDRDGNIWPSDSEKFHKSGMSETFLRELCTKIDDGTEPLVTQENDCGIIAAQLTTEKTNCGYVIIAMPQNGPEPVFNNIDVLEIVINQVSLIAKLIEKNNLLYELQIKHLNNFGNTRVAN